MAEVESGEFSEVELQLGLQHAYHHLNFACNTRRTPDRRVTNLTQRDFNRWGKYPDGVEWRPLHRTSASDGLRKQ